MSRYSEADVAALKRALAALSEQPTDIHRPELAELKAWATAAGACFPAAAPPPAAEPAAAEANDADDDGSEPDEERWTLSDAEPAAIPAKAGEPSDEEAETAMAAKGEAVDLHGEGQQEAAIAKMSEALAQTPNNAMYWGLRALYNLEANKPRAALHDANTALDINPQNVRALRVRGTVNRHLGRWEDSLRDLSAAQAIDYDDATNETLKFVQDRATQRHKRELARQQAAEEAAVRRQEELRRQRQREAEEEAAAAAAAEEESMGGMPGGMGGMPGGMGGMPGGMGGMPGGMGGMPGGMGGMPGGMGGVPGGMPGGMPPGMESIMQDPEIMAAMQDPEVAPKLAQMMQNPMAAMSMMNDPKVGPVMQKIMSKMMGGGGMPGGMGGMPGGMGGMGRGRGGGMSGGPSRATQGEDLD